ncbi:MAG TPA: ABC transporter permease, partial [Chloroflexota bacterium]|nr:ABC transporter permease [Chloroflexota bacterium]
QVVIRAAEVDVQAQDTGYIPYLAVSVVVLGLMVEGLIQAGVNAAREYEEGTITELMLSPASRWAISTGKILGALVLNASAGIAVLVVVVLILAVTPVYPLEVIGYGLILMVTFVAIGTLIGTLLRRRQATVPLSFALTLPLFFVSGPFGPANWLGSTAGTLALVSPVYYAIGIFQHAFHGYQTTQSGLATNSAILVGFAIVALTATTLILRRTGAAQ